MDAFMHLLGWVLLVGMPASLVIRQIIIWRRNTKRLNRRHETEFAERKLHQYFIAREYMRGFDDGRAIPQQRAEAA